MKLLENPFYILKCLPESSKSTIIEQAENRSFEIEEQLCNDAKNILLNPSQRLEAEVCWFPGFDTELLTKRLSSIFIDFQKYISDFIFEKTKFYLAEANLLAFGLENEKDPNFWSTDNIRLAISYLCSNSEKINYDETKKLLESSREIAKIPSNISDDQLINYIEEQKNYYKQASNTFLKKLETKTLADTLTSLAQESTDYGEKNCKWFLLEQIIHDYEIDRPKIVEERYLHINGMIDTLSISDTLKNESDPFLIEWFDCFSESLNILIYLLKPIIILKQSKGQNYDLIDTIFNSIRNLSIKSCNEYTNYTFSYRLILLCKNLFSDIREIADLIEEDRKIVDSFINEREQKKSLLYFYLEWGNPIKSVKTDSNSITIDNKETYDYTDIIKYKYSQSENELIYSFITTKSDLPVQLKLINKDIFEKFSQIIWRGIGTKILRQYLDLLKHGNKIEIGKIKIFDYGIELSNGSSFFSTTKMFPWNELQNIEYKGDIIKVVGPDSYEVVEYIYNDYNLEVLQIMLMLMYRKGLKGKMSDL